MTSVQQTRKIRLTAAGLVLALAAPGALAQPPEPASADDAAARRQPAQAAAPPPATEPAAKAQPSLSREPRHETSPEDAAVYVPPPPDRRVPGGRVGGSTRGPASCPSQILALVPEDHAGLTASAQPTLYWFVSETTACRIDFVLNDPRAIAPRVERQLTGPHAAGIHALSLADFAVSLEPGIVYSWSVALVADPEARSKDVLSGGQIERVDASDEANGSSVVAHAQSLGERGLWYDALAALQRGIVSSQPGADEDRVAASKLLVSQGLGASAAQEPSRIDVAAPPP